MSEVVLVKNYESLYKESLIQINELNKDVQLFELRKAQIEQLVVINQKLTTEREQIQSRADYKDSIINIQRREIQQLRQKHEEEQFLMKEKIWQLENQVKDYGNQISSLKNSLTELQPSYQVVAPMKSIAEMPLPHFCEFVPRTIKSALKEEIVPKLAYVEKRPKLLVKVQRMERVTSLPEQRVIAVKECNVMELKVSMKIQPTIIKKVHRVVQVANAPGETVTRMKSFTCSRPALLTMAQMFEGRIVTLNAVLDSSTKRGPTMMAKIQSVAQIVEIKSESMAILKDITFMELRSSIMNQHVYMTVNVLRISPAANVFPQTVVKAVRQLKVSVNNEPVLSTKVQLKIAQASEMKAENVVPLKKNIAPPQPLKGPAKIQPNLLKSISKVKNRMYDVKREQKPTIKNRKNRKVVIESQKHDSLQKDVRFSNTGKTSQDWRSKNNKMVLTSIFVQGELKSMKTQVPVSLDERKKSSLSNIAVSKPYKRVNKKSVYERKRPTYKNGHHFECTEELWD